MIDNRIFIEIILLGIWIGSLLYRVRDLEKINKEILEKWQKTTIESFELIRDQVQIIDLISQDLKLLPQVIEEIIKPQKENQS